MAKRPPPIFLPAVGHDIADILEWSAKHFGAMAATRYEALIRQALRDVQADPQRPGTKPVPISRPTLTSTT